MLLKRRASSYARLSYCSVDAKGAMCERLELDLEYMAAAHTSQHCVEG